MSVFGGDSWGREANYRKRRIEDLFVQQIDESESSSSSYKKLPNGKYACLVCSHRPLLDTPLMLSMHMKGSRHCAAKARLEEKELMRQEEMSKRIALSNNSVSSTSTCVPTQKYRLASNPLIERTRKAVSEALCSNPAQQCTTDKSHIVKSTINPIMNGSSSNNNNPIVEVVAGKQVSVQEVDYKERREKELKFTAAGWKRDGFGGWYKDESVEFDSDEEDPNISLA